MRIAVFVAKVALLGAFMGAAYVGAQRVLAPGYVDDFYPKFTGSASGLVVGVSRESYGVSPAILEECLAGSGEDLVIENFAVIYEESDYGEVYLDAIRRKLDPDTRDGVFIVGVNPASLSQYISDGDDPPDDSRSRLAQLKSVTADPNLEYIRRFYGKALYKAFTRTGESYNLRTAHSDGWVEMKRQAPAYVMTDSGMAVWRGMTLDRMVRDMPRIAPSSHRMAALGQTLDFLGDHGRVWVIRMPIDPEVLALERRYWPDFNGAVSELAATHGARFLDYSRLGEAFETYDGSHLLSGGARAFTRRLCEDLAPSG